MAYSMWQATFPLGHDLDQKTATHFSGSCPVSKTTEYAQSRQRSGRNFRDFFRFAKEIRQGNFSRCDRAYQYTPYLAAMRRALCSSDSLRVALVTGLVVAGLVSAVVAVVVVVVVVAAGAWVWAGVWVWACVVVIWDWVGASDWTWVVAGAAA